MPPPPNARRTARRRGASGPPRDIDGLTARLAQARNPGGAAAVTARARKMLAAYLDTAAARGLPFRDVVRMLADGTAAVQVAGVDLGPQAAGLGPVACASGCAFCCILNGKDGGTVTEAEARRLHDALAPLAGQPDGRAWHPQGCAALDPETRSCRAYDARPMICRTYHSTSAEACRSNAEGTPAAGAGVLSAQLVYLAALALSRAVLEGVARTPTYALARVSAGAADGQDAAAALDAARHPPRALRDEQKRLATAHDSAARARPTGR